MLGTGLLPWPSRKTDLLSLLALQQHDDPQFFWLMYYLGADVAASAYRARPTARQVAQRSFHGRLADSLALARPLPILPST